MKQLEPIRTAHLADELRGKWVAMRNGEVVEAGDTFDAVMMNLDRQNVTDVTIMRIPDEHEAELVGLG